MVERLDKLVEVWRYDASMLLKAVKNAQYPDQQTRVRWYDEAMTLRRCAKLLQYHLKRAKERNEL